MQHVTPLSNSIYDTYTKIVKLTLTPLISDKRISLFNICPESVFHKAFLFQRVYMAL